MRKLPIFGDIPVIGVLFKKRVDDTTDRELIIFVTPHVIAPGESRAALPGVGDQIAQSKKEKVKEDLETVELLKSLRE
jgi:Flp pilus assembly secretin CpaC